jgi:hypothetical protein
LKIFVKKWIQSLEWSKSDGFLISHQVDLRPLNSLAVVAPNLLASVRRRLFAGLNFIKSSTLDQK